jgi:hypothetical protein
MQARGQQSFFIMTGDGPPEIVIRIINGIIVSAPYDPAITTFETRFHVVEVVNMDQRSIYPIRVEKLKRRAPPSS